MSPKPIMLSQNASGFVMRPLYSLALARAARAVKLWVRSRYHDDFFTVNAVSDSP